MTRHPITRSGLLLISLLLPVFPLAAEESNARELLRDALYSEEVTRDPAKAAENYRKVLALYDEQQPIAAAALFRLAEVTRKQGNKDEAIRLYQRLLREFPAAEAEGKQARENLATLGAKDIPSPGKVVVDEDEQELLRVKELAVSSPDRVRERSLTDEAVKKGQIKVVEYLLESGFLSNPADFVGTAVGSGNVRMVELLLKKAGEIDQSDGRYALRMAVDRGYKEVALVLLKHKIDPNFLMSDGGRLSDGSMREESPLHIAAKTGNLEMSRVLLEHGADPNLAPTHCSYPDDGRYPRGTPLHEAAMKDSRLVRLLLEKGATAGAQAPMTGLTPLHFAARFNHSAAIELLLDHGAPVDAGSKEVASIDPGRNNQPGGQTPLMLAVESKAMEAAKLLLAKGADANARDDTDRPVIGRALWISQLPILKLLLENRADPNSGLGKLTLSRDPGGHGDPFYNDSSSSLSFPESILMRAASNSNLEVVKTLLDAGAQPGPALSEILRGVADDDEDGSLVRRLLSYHKGEINLQELPRMEDWKPAAQTAFLETMVYPALSRQEKIQLVFPNRGEALALESDRSSPQALSLAVLLYYQSVKLFNYRNSRVRDLTVIRKGPEGTWTRLPLNLENDAPFPELQRGDIVEVGTSNSKETFSTPQDVNDSKILWALRRRISIPVTVELDGKSRNIRLRGDRFTFDPSSDEIPLVGTSQLAGMLWRPEVYPTDGLRPKVSLIRAGWPELPVPWGKESDADLPFQAADKLVITSPEWKDESNKARLAQIMITSGGLPYSYQITGYRTSETEWSPVSIPTLIQALAEVNRGYDDRLGSAPADPAALPAWLIQNRQMVFYMLPHPDYSRIRIRRLQKDGTEQIIPVNLAAAIEASSDQTTPAEARAADMNLQPGDIIDLPVREDLGKQPWQGPSAKEIAFFAKALDARIQLQTAQGGLELREISFRPQRYIAAGSTWIPLPPLERSSTLRAYNALGTNTDVSITREGAGTSPEIPSRSVWLRDGDLVKIRAEARQQVVPPSPPPVPVQPQVRPPRPRGVSPNR